MTAPITVSQTRATTLTEVQSRFAAWRTKRKNSRSAIPEELWSAAAMLCTDNSVHKISREVAISHQTLHHCDLWPACEDCRIKLNRLYPTLKM